MGRFLCADENVSTGQGLLGNNMFAYCRNNPVNRADPTGDIDWGTLFDGVGLLSVGITACVVAAAVVSGGACLPLLVVAGATFMAGGMTVANGAAEVVESITGNNVMRDTVYGGNTAYYEKQKVFFSTVAEAGTAVLSLKSGSTNLCFVAGTVILAEEGRKRIEEIEPGDYVWAWDEETGDIALKEVVETYVNETDELVHVFVNGEEIIATPAHPFYSPVKGWTDAVHLRAGDILVLVNGEYVVVEKVQHEILEAPITVYNFQVDGYHTYYVSQTGVLVHNTCGRTGKQTRLRELADDDKLSSALRGEIKRDINAIARGQRTTIRVPQGYQLAHRIGYPAKQGYSYAYSDLKTIAGHKLRHKIFGYK